MTEKFYLDNLRARWQVLMDRLDVDASEGSVLLDDLFARYQGAERHYHNLNHIHNMLMAIDILSELAVDVRLVQLAAWYHDVIYDARANDNEEKSAILAGKALKRMGLEEASIQSVQAMIRATAINSQTPDDRDSHILLDADLATLASDEQQYDENARLIRVEFDFVPEPDFNAGRAGVLRMFLDRARIFHTDLMHEMLEDKARQNILRELESLS